MNHFTFEVARPWELREFGYFWNQACREDQVLHFEDSLSVRTVRVWVSGGDENAPNSGFGIPSGLFHGGFDPDIQF